MSSKNILYNDRFYSRTVRKAFEKLIKPNDGGDDSEKKSEDKSKGTMNREFSQSDEDSKWLCEIGEYLKNIFCIELISKLSLTAKH